MNQFEQELVAASRKAYTFLSGVGAEHEDMRQDAIVWCLEHREQKPDGLSVALWYQGALRNMLQGVRRRFERNPSVSLDQAEHEGWCRPGLDVTLGDYKLGSR